MRYKIYKLIGKEKILPDGYETKTKTTYKLEAVDKWDDCHTYESAIEYITQNVDGLKGDTLTILPIIDIDWGGGIRF